VLVPPLGQTVDTVTLVAWYKQEGEAVAQGEMLFAIETDKATLDIEAPASGVLRRVTAQPGDEVKVLTSIALIAAPDEEELGSGRSPTEPAGWHGQRPAIAEGRPAPAVGRPAPAGAGGPRLFISPRARWLAEEQGVPLAALQATGPQGAIVERDVRAYLDGQAALPLPSELSPRAARLGSPKPQAEGFPQVPSEAGTPEREVLQSIPLRGVRAVIAERMLHSATSTAHVTLNAEADATALADLHHQVAQDGLEVSYNDLLLFILGRALRDHPQLNASLQGEAIQVWWPIHVGLAVDTDRGLLVPVVRDVDRKGLAQLAVETRSLAERARAGRCTPEELSGGTFTLTNLGLFGIDSFTPIINLPECAILGVGRIKKQPAVVGDQVVVRQMVWLSLTFDHRLVDSAPAARFLQRVVQLIEHPYLLLT